MVHCLCEKCTMSYFLWDLLNNDCALERNEDWLDAHTWRIIFSEVKPANRDVDTLTFLWNISVPLFIGKQLPLDLNIRPVVSAGKTFINIQNNANSHVQINQISIIDENKKEIASNAEMKYLLAKKSYQFDFGHINIKDWHKYKLLITTDKQEKPLEFNIQGEL